MNVERRTFFMGFVSVCSGCSSISKSTPQATLGSVYVENHDNVRHRVTVSIISLEGRSRESTIELSPAGKSDSSELLWNFDGQTQIATSLTASTEDMSESLDIGELDSSKTYDVIVHINSQDTLGFFVAESSTSN